MDSRIHIAFRFHGNFYHSYRGDTPDELGFGRDIRIIRHIIKVLDDCNREGLPVRGTWDFENYFSLETIMPAHCPDIIQALQRRVADGMDEMELMSYNNGLVNVHTPREFNAAIQRALTNPQGSGLQDLFGEGVARIVRPQEMMFTPIHLKLYRALGVEAISLYYSAVPFNGFSNFIPRLSPAEMYNPLTLTCPGIQETMTLLPCYNVGDLADHLTLRRWVKGMRRQQMAMKEPCDLLLIFDQDADDPCWEGYEVPGFVKKMLSTAGGLEAMIANIADLDYIEFTTPGGYLKEHAPLRQVSFGQDTADGSFDGLSSWTEKWANHHIFTGLERARLLDLQARRLLEGKPMPAEVQALLDEAFEERVRILSTTHFGMAAPLMNLTRLNTAQTRTDRAVKAAAGAFELARGSSRPDGFALVDYVRGENTPEIQFQAHPARALVRLALRPEAPETLAVSTSSGEDRACSVLERHGDRELVFVEAFAAGEERRYVLKAGPAARPARPVQCSPASLDNGLISVRFDPDGQVTDCRLEGRQIAAEKFFSSGVTYGGKRTTVRQWRESAAIDAGVVAGKRMEADLPIGGGHSIHFEREILLAADLPYVYVRMKVAYPHTAHQGYREGTAVRLQQSWDNAWQEVLPLEIAPRLAGSPESPLRVWKHDYCDHISSYSLDYAVFSKNAELDNANNQVTNGWVAVSDGQAGLLLAQNADVCSSTAFCPLRTRRDGDTQRVRMNPFGSYWGHQYRYATADTGLGLHVATTFSAADQVKPYAPSYNGRGQEFELMLAPYTGDRPPEAARQDAEAFAYPPIVLNDEGWIADPPHRSWQTQSMGEFYSGRAGK